MGDVANVESGWEGALVRKYALLEPLAIFVLIMAYIWDLRFTHPALWIGILALMLLSHRMRREGPGMLGFRASNLREGLRDYAPVLLFLTLAMLGGGLLMQTTRRIGFDQALLSWMGYLPWGVFQQYILNAYFLNRFDAALGRRAAPLVSAAMFSGAHTPNWFLMAVTLIAGYCCARLYHRYHNLYFLGVAHGTIGFLLFLVVPDSISRHLRVGPAWHAAAGG
jgi:hypothetical protein